jgi:hypothetical protein
MRIFRQSDELLWEHQKTLFASDHYGKAVKESHCSTLQKGRFLYFYKKVHNTEVVKNERASAKLVLCRYDFNEPDFDPIVLPEYEISEETMSLDGKKSYSVIFGTDSRSSEQGVLFHQRDTVLEESEADFL